MEDSVLIDVGLPIVLAIVMVGIGMTLSVGDFSEQRKSPRAAIIGSVGQLLLLPLLGMFVAWVTQAPAAIAIGLVLVAATPGGSTSNLITYLCKGNVALGIVLTVVTSLAVVFTLPFWVRQAISIWGDEMPAGQYVAVPFGDIAMLLLVVIFIPMGVGMLIRVRKPALAARLERFVSMIGLTVLIVLIFGIIASLGSEVPGMLRAAGPATLLLSLLAISVGIGMGVLGGLSRSDQLAIGIELSIKNVTLGMLIGLSVLHSDEIALPSAVYGVVMYLAAAEGAYLGKRWMGGGRQVKVAA